MGISGVKKRFWKKSSEVLGHAIGHTGTVRKIRGKLIAEYTVPASGYKTKEEIVAEEMRGTIKHAEMCSEVRILTHRIGEVQNLADPVLQRRSCAALLAKKYAREHFRLGQIYSALKKRELTDGECADVERILGEWGLAACRGERPVGDGEQDGPNSGLRADQVRGAAPGGDEAAPDRDPVEEDLEHAGLHDAPGGDVPDDPFPDSGLELECDDE